MAPGAPAWLMTLGPDLARPRSPRISPLPPLPFPGPGRRAIGARRVPFDRRRESPETSRRSWAGACGGATESGRRGAGAERGRDGPGGMPEGGARARRRRDDGWRGDGRRRRRAAPDPERGCLPGARTGASRPGSGAAGHGAGPPGRRIGPATGRGAGARRATAPCCRRDAAAEGATLWARRSTALDHRVRRPPGGGRDAAPDAARARSPRARRRGFEARPPPGRRSPSPAAAGPAPSAHGSRYFRADASTPPARRASRRAGPGRGLARLPTLPSPAGPSIRCIPRGRAVALFLGRDARARAPAFRADRASLTLRAPRALNAGLRRRGPRRCWTSKH